MRKDSKPRKTATVEVEGEDVLIYLDESEAELMGTARVPLPFTAEISLYGFVHHMRKLGYARVELIL